MGAQKIDVEHPESMQKKIEYLIGSRVRDRKKMMEASKNIDKLQRKVSGLSGVEIIRKFRGKI